MKFRFPLVLTPLLLLILPVVVAAETVGAPVNDNPIPFFAKTIGCALIGIPTCLAIDGHDVQYSRSRHQWGGEISYLPSYVLNSQDGRGAQHVDANVYVSNVLFDVSARRGFKADDTFASTSERLAYSFDSGRLRPAIGLGTRSNKDARNSDALELWFPVFANWQVDRESKFAGFLETIWVINRERVSLEATVRASYVVRDHLAIGLGVGYFSDYPKPDTEFSIGPTIYF